MHIKKECIAMLLAGGQGSRLYTLTEKNAKPAVPFGGKYRIIDFTLSNCINSNIFPIGVLTQYQPLVLNEYIGSGEPWDLDRNHGGVFILPPYQGNKTADWYKGTANAIYQNIHFINRYDPDYVLILSGDHIYKMDYSLMLDYHKQKNSDCTIAVIEVPIDQASRFGIMNTGPDGRISEFEEKPEVPESNKASMGIYIFSKNKLFDYLIKDDADPKSVKDFGKNIIPAMLNNNEKLFAYPFSGYWKDVGTISSLWEANMDLLGVTPNFDLYDRSWRIYSRNYALPPHYVGNNAFISNSIITEGCSIYGNIENSVLFQSVKVAAGACVKDSVIMGDVEIGAGAEVYYSIIDGDTKISAGAVIGKQKCASAEITVIGSNLYIAPGIHIKDGEMVNAAYLANDRHKKDD